MFLDYYTLNLLLHFQTHLNYLRDVTRQVRNPRGSQAICCKIGGIFLIYGHSTGPFHTSFSATVQLSIKPIGHSNFADGRSTV